MIQLCSSCGAAETRIYSLHAVIIHIFIGFSHMVSTRKTWNLLRNIFLLVLFLFNYTLRGTIFNPSSTANMVSSVPCQKLKYMYARFLGKYLTQT